MLTIAAASKHLAARIGITAELPAWDSALTHHPHTHVIVPGGGGGASDSVRWTPSRPAFLLPVRVLGALLRLLFLIRLHDAGKLALFGSMAGLVDRRTLLRHFAPVMKRRWVVYAKPPFAGSPAVLAYLSRGSHRVALSNAGVSRARRRSRHHGPSGRHDPAWRNPPIRRRKPAPIKVTSRALAA